jgi:hypothetical protein
MPSIPFDAQSVMNELITHGVTDNATGSIVSLPWFGVVTLLSAGLGGAPTQRTFVLFDPGLNLSAVKRFGKTIKTAGVASGFSLADAALYPRVILIGQNPGAETQLRQEALRTVMVIPDALADDAREVLAGLLG